MSLEVKIQILSHRLFYARKLLINKRFPGFLFMLTFAPYFWRVTNLVTNLRIFRVEAGVNGQFRTPRHIIRMMVDLMQPKENDIDKRGLNR